MKHIKTLIAVVILCGTMILPARAQNDFEIAKNVDIFISILRELNAKYADEISPGELTNTAIDAMLESLDPYTIYYTENEIEDVKMITSGQYGGIGALIQQYGKDKVAISEIYEDCPAQKSGVLAGDIITKVDGKSTAGKNSTDISSAMRGQPGTTVTLEVFRPSKNKTLNFSITREEITLPNIPYYGMLDNTVGYIKLDQFTDKAGKEVRDAFTDLKGQGMTALILDLRNNGGGLLQEAVKIMNIFVEQGNVIVYTKGKIEDQNHIFRTPAHALDKDIPVVVLVNEHSASASEIVAGAFQDLDRGVIVGKKSYGKGLVQNIVPLSFNSSMKLTVSKYYIPSGRCVQKIEYFSKDSTKSHVIPDSLAVAFKTQNGRTVYDKGGIEPDVPTPADYISSVLTALIFNNHIFDFANQYHADHTAIAPADQFVVDEKTFNEFLNFVGNKDYDYTTETEEVMKDLKEAAEYDNYFEKIEPLYRQLEEQLEHEKRADLQTHKKEICEYLASEIAVRYYYQKGRIINQLSIDPDINTAKEILHDRNRYNSILNIK
ncbi:MAG: S41 family peptidase [Bacteroidales bacterium]|nr:S41 family peptidase [Bacteroidales bacterium]